jgi:hypothetical protein
MRDRFPVGEAHLDAVEPEWFPWVCPRCGRTYWYKPGGHVDLDSIESRCCREVLADPSVTEEKVLAVAWWRKLFERGLELGHVAFVSPLAFAIPDESAEED